MQGPKSAPDNTKKKQSKSIEKAIQNAAKKLNIDNVGAFKSGFNSYPEQRVFPEFNSPLEVIDHYAGWAYANNRRRSVEKIELPVQFGLGYYEGLSNKMNRGLSDSYRRGYHVGQEHAEKNEQGERL